MCWTPILPPAIRPYIAGLPIPTISAPKPRAFIMSEPVLIPLSKKIGVLFLRSFFILTKAFNDAKEKIQKKISDEMSSITGGI